MQMTYFFNCIFFLKLGYVCTFRSLTFCKIHGNSFGAFGIKKFSHKSSNTRRIGAAFKTLLYLPQYIYLVTTWTVNFVLKLVFKTLFLLILRLLILFLSNKMVDNTKFQVCIRFCVVEHFIDKKRVDTTKFSTNWTVQVVGILFQLHCKKCRTF